MEAMVAPGWEITSSLVDSPLGAPLRVVSETDARLEAAQLTPERQAYWGAPTDDLITLSPGDVVVDVGGNVGSFARLAASVVGETGLVYSVEPIPQVYPVLEDNARTFHEYYAEKRADGLQVEQPATIIPVHAGIVPDPGKGTEEFVFFPRCAAFSTQASLRDDADAVSASCSLVMHGKGEGTTWLQTAAQKLARAVPWAYKPVHAAVSQRLLLGGAQVVACPVMTLSDLIDKYDIQRIDLLKVNVERGELGVLQSLRKEHWPRVRQVTMQLHDRNGNLEEAVELLKAWGLARTRVLKEPRFLACCLVQVYASRPAAE